MATIAENLQTINSSLQNIKQALIDKGVTVEGDITSYADAIRGIETGGGECVRMYAFIIPDAYSCHVFAEGMTFEDYVNSEDNNSTHPNKWTRLVISQDSNGEPCVTYEHNVDGGVAYSWLIHNMSEMENPMTGRVLPQHLCAPYAFYDMGDWQ